MADEKKFLDQAGVQYLWSQLSMEDYPNNETLIAVLNAIDQTKADKEEVDKQIAVMNDRVVATDDGELTNVLPDMFGGHTPDEYMLKAEMPEVEKSDWSVNDENDAAYIKNRTHWTNDDGTVHKIDEKYLPDIGVRSWNDLTDKPFGDNADGTVYPMSGKYVEGMGWSEKSVSGKVVVKETAYRVNNSDFGMLVNPEPLENGSYAAMPTEFSFESGKTYRITVDGVPYIGTAEYRDGYGNFGGGDGVPLVDENGGYHGVFVTAMGAGYSNYFYYDEGPEVGHTGTFIIEEVTEVETIHPIDQKFLPSGGSGVSDGDFVVNFTEDGDWGDYVMDRDAIELIDAYHTGKNVVGFVQCKKSQYHMIKLFATNVREDETKYILDFETIRIDYSSSYDVLFYTLKVEVFYDTPESPQISFVVFRNSVQQV